MRADLARSMSTARACSDIQAAIIAVLGRIGPDAESPDGDAEFDQWGERLRTLAARRAALLTKASEAREPDQARLARAAWGIRLRMAKLRMRVRMHASAERGLRLVGRGDGRIPGPVGCQAAPLRRQWPTAMAEWARVQSSGADESASDANRLLLQQWDTRGASDRLDGIEKAPLPGYVQFEECRQSELAAAVGRDKVSQGLLLELEPVKIQVILAAFERRLRGHDSDRINLWIGSTIVLLRKPRDSNWLEHWRPICLAAAVYKWYERYLWESLRVRLRPREMSRWSTLLDADNLYIAAGSWEQALARGRAYEAALTSIGLRFSPRLVNAVANAQAGFAPQLEFMAGPVVVRDRIVCLGVALDGRGSTDTTCEHCLGEAEGVHWKFNRPLSSRCVPLGESASARCGGVLLVEGGGHNCGRHPASSTTLWKAPG